MRIKNTAIKTAFLYCVLATGAAFSSFADCWDVRERGIIEQIQLDGEFDGSGLFVVSLKDATNCTPIPGVEVILKGASFMTDDRGYAEIKGAELDLIFDDRLPFRFAKKGYIPLVMSSLMNFGLPVKTKFLMTKELPLESARFILQWDEKPEDLDLHLKSEDFHISYHNTRSAAGRAQLDRDDTSSYGPETITLSRIEAEKTYQVYVHNYSKEVSFQGLASVQVYANNKLLKVIDLPRSDSRKIIVATIRDKEFEF